AVALRYSERPAGSTPKIAFFVKDRTSASVIEAEFLKGQYRKDIFQQHEGKPLLLVGHTTQAVPAGSGLDAFTARHTWARLSPDAPKDLWTFKQLTDPTTNPGSAYYDN